MKKKNEITDWLDSAVGVSDFSARPRFQKKFALIGRKGRFATLRDLCARNESYRKALFNVLLTMHHAMILGNCPT